MDMVYETALKRHDELKGEMEELKKFIDLYKRTRHILGLDSTEHKETLMPSSDVSSGDSSESPEAVDSTEKSVKRPRVTDNPRPALVVAEAIRILREHGRPMSRRDLHAALSERGLVVKGSDPVKALGTMFWRATDDLMQIDKLGYWPVSEAYAPIGYSPSVPDDGGEQEPDNRPFRLEDEF